MARAGEELISPIGERLIFRKTARDTDGELLEMEAVYRPHSSRPREHYHPYQEEHFEVLQGEICAKIGDQERLYKAGEAFVIAAGIHHRMHNVSNTEARVLWQTRPALKTETFFETLWGLAREGKTDAQGVPNLLQVAVIAQAYGREFRLARPAYGVQRVVFAILAPIGRALGYRGHYARYSQGA
jgi:quercetin dioxygenase-like cupin family protein